MAKRGDLKPGGQTIRWMRNEEAVPLSAQRWICQAGGTVFDNGHQLVYECPAEHIRKPMSHLVLWLEHNRWPWHRVLHLDKDNYNNTLENLFTKGLADG